MNANAVTKEQLAKDILTLAAAGGMPDSYWSHDSRIQRACAILGWGPHPAMHWARLEIDK